MKPIAEAADGSLSFMFGLGGEYTVKIVLIPIKIKVDNKPLSGFHLTTGQLCYGRSSRAVCFDFAPMFHSTTFENVKDAIRIVRKRIIVMFANFTLALNEE